LLQGLSYGACSCSTNRNPAVDKTPSFASITAARNPLLDFLVNQVIPLISRLSNAVGFN
jgi:hypothetical protein